MWSSLSLRQGKLVNRSPPACSNISRFPTLISSTVSRQSEAKAGEMTATFLMPRPGSSPLKVCLVDHPSGESGFKHVVNETLRAGLSAPAARKSKRYKVKPAALGGVLPGVDLDKALALADAIEDQELMAKMQLRK